MQGQREISHNQNRIMETQTCLLRTQSKASEDAAAAAKDSANAATKALTAYEAQGVTLNRQAQHMEDALTETRKAADAAMKSAEAADAQRVILEGQSNTLKAQHAAIETQGGHMLRQLKLTKAALKNAQKTDRAWVSLHSLEVAESSRPSGRMVILELRNSGRTPAIILSANVSVRSTVVTSGNGETEIEPLTSLPDHPEWDDDIFVPPAMLVAGEKTRWRHVVQITDKNLAFHTLQPGEDNNLWIYGFVKYTDIYNRSEESAHEYRFGREYDRILSKYNRAISFAHLGKAEYNKAG